MAMMIQSNITTIRIAAENAGRLTYRADGFGETLICGRRGKLAMPKRDLSQRYCPIPTADIDGPDTGMEIIWYNGSEYWIMHRWL